jgi:hypothetical protein
MIVEAALDVAFREAKISTQEMHAREVRI